MGKATRWFRGLLGLKKPDDAPPPHSCSSKPTYGTAGSNHHTRRWSLVRSYREKPSSSSSSNSTTTTSHHLRRPDPCTRPPRFYYGEAPEAPNTTPEPGYLDNIKVRSGANKNHGIAAEAEAAMAAAHAAAAVSVLGTGSRRSDVVSPVYGSGCVNREAAAALVIQSHFRSYLARRALRALKGLVKLQALVRGHIMRKRTAETMRCMQALLRAQARARARRAHLPKFPHSSGKSSVFYNSAGPATPEKFEHVVQARNPKHDQSSKLRRNQSRSQGRVPMYQDRGSYSSTWLDPRMDETMWDRQGPSLSTEDDRTDRVLEMDPGRTHSISNHRNVFESPYPGLAPEQGCHSHETPEDSSTCQSFVEVRGWNHFKLQQEEDLFCTAESSPRFQSSSSKGGSSRRGEHTPTKSGGSVSGYWECCPGYMAYTESARAKVRSVSAPRQRPEYERARSTKRHSTHGFLDSGSSTARNCAVDATLAYPGSGRLDRFGMPVSGSVVGHHSGV